MLGRGPVHPSCGALLCAAGLCAPSPEGPQALRWGLLGWAGPWTVCLVHVSQDACLAAVLSLSCLLHGVVSTRGTRSLLFLLVTLHAPEGPLPKQLCHLAMQAISSTSSKSLARKEFGAARGHETAPLGSESGQHRGSHHHDPGVRLREQEADNSGREPWDPRSQAEATCPSPRQQHPHVPWLPCGLSVTPSVCSPGPPLRWSPVLCLCFGRWAGAGPRAVLGWGAHRFAPLELILWSGALGTLGLSAPRSGGCD